MLGAEDVACLVTRRVAKTPEGVRSWWAALAPHEQRSARSYLDARDDSVLRGEDWDELGVFVKLLGKEPKPRDRKRGPADESDRPRLGQWAGLVIPSYRKEAGHLDVYDLRRMYRSWRAEARAGYLATMTVTMSADGVSLDSWAMGRGGTVGPQLRKRCAGGDWDRETAILDAVKACTALATATRGTNPAAVRDAVTKAADATKHAASICGRHVPQIGRDWIERVLKTAEDVRIDGAASRGDGPHHEAIETVARLIGLGPGTVGQWCTRAGKRRPTDRP